MGGKSRPNPRLALTLTGWSRYAEISADRAGAYCSNDLESVAHALFKLASGLSGRYANFSVAAVPVQDHEMQLEDGQPGQGAPIDDWFLTHPFSPLRVKALKLFHDSELAFKGGISVNELDMAVEAVMSLMEPSYLEGKTDTAEAMRRLLFAAAIAVADVSCGISAEEVTVFEEFFGDAAFSDKLDTDQLKSEVDDRVKQANALTSLPQRMQIVRDLCLVSRADGHSTGAERELLCDIASALDVPALFVEKNLEADPELD